MFGLDDSRNTARLAWRMICDGCVMKITKSLDKVRPCKPSEQSGMVLIAQTNGSVQEDGNPISDDKQDFKIHPTSVHSNAINEVRFTPFVLPSKITNKISGRQQDGMMGVARVDVQPPQNLLHGLSTTILGFGSKYRHSNQNSLGPLQNRRQTGTFTSTPANNAHQCPSHVLFSTTIMSVNDVSGMEVDSSSDLSILADWEEAAVIADSQEEQSVGSGENEESVLPPVDSLSASVLRLDDDKPNLQPNTKSIPCHPSTLNSKSVVYRSPDTTIYNVSLKKQVSNNSKFKLPTALSNKPVPQTVLNSTVNLSSNNRPTKLTRITAPMCNCGRRAKKLTVSNGGPNQGRVFYSCAIRKRDNDGKGCSYFKWEDTLLKEKSLDSSSILSSSRISVTSNTSLASSVCSETRNTFKLRPSLRT
ncbi:hypothetical protein AB205_0202610 [Aquarana catesbeiana]|uniref:GRF-type domain-containing protein n=1 Tax=Aquarana catesbeiana TaxID=8400 RepID=A0A2G9S1V6_AQUCT|nr:hypothetical protein AB205_0202610 [Aquarana catesbeiana]